MHLLLACQPPFAGRSMNLLARGRNKSRVGLLGPICTACCFFGFYVDWARGDDSTIERLHYAHEVFGRFCYDCHGSDAQEANLNIESLLTKRPLIKNHDDWKRIIEILEMGAMPPAEMPQPKAIERDNLLAVLDEQIVRYDFSTIDNPGFEPMRRLTHRQFNNTIRDLFGADLKPADRFPEEMAGQSGFDNSANTLFLQSSLMERYIAAAEGILARALPEQPTTEVHRQTRQLIFVAEPGKQLDATQAATKVLRRFLLRAYRRPPTSDEVESVVKLYQQAASSGQDYHESIRSVLPAILISPKFLFRIEAEGQSDEPYRINDWELASRLSYFLWNSMPDEELFELAKQGDLSDPEVLKTQVERMLAGPKADELGVAFAGQWFSTRLIGGRIRLDPIDNPWCTDSLMEAMREETAMFFTHLLRADRPISELVDCDYTFMNEELAKTLYKRSDIEGVEMRKVPLYDRNRGGIMTQPAVLTVTSSHFDTNPIKRGIFVLDQLLGIPPPPPPPDAGELEENIRRNRKLSFREKLELHSSDATCRACHTQIDPFGFSLENFDYFGRWRDFYGRRQAIDNTAQITSGATFAGPAGLKEFLLTSRHEELVRQTSSKLLAYALGRQIDYYDEPALRKIETALEKNDYRFQTLLLEVVNSYPFQYRKNPEQEALQ